MARPGTGGWRRLKFQTRSLLANCPFIPRECLNTNRKRCSNVHSFDEGAARARARSISRSARGVVCEAEGWYSSSSSGSELACICAIGRDRIRSFNRWFENSPQKSVWRWQKVAGTHELRVARRTFASLAPSIVSRTVRCVAHVSLLRLLGDSTAGPQRFLLGSGVQATCGAETSFVLRANSLPRRDALDPVDQARGAKSRKSALSRLSCRAATGRNQERPHTDFARGALNAR